MFDKVGILPQKNMHESISYYLSISGPSVCNGFFKLPGILLVDMLQMYSLVEIS